MQNDIDERAIEIAKYVFATGATVRTTAEKFGISKSTVHKDLSVRLKYIDGKLYKEAQKVLAKNRAERHLRGGNATKEKYAKKSIV